MLIFNYLVDELLRDVGHLIQMQRYHSCQLVLENLNKVNSSVGADYDLVFQRRRLNLVNVSNLLEAFSDVQSKWANRNYVDEAVIFAAYDLVLVNLSKGSYAGFCPDVFYALKVLLDVEHLHLVLPGANKDELLRQ